MKVKIKGTNASSFNLPTLGDSKFEVSYIAGLSDADSDSITFYRGDNLDLLSSFEVGILLVDESLKGSIDTFNSKGIVFCENPKFEWIKVISDNFENTFEPAVSKPIYHSSVRIAKEAYLEGNVSIGAHSQIYPNVSIFKDVEIGEGCEIQSGTVVGAIGLGDVWNNGAYHKFVHLGKVIIGKSVSIGANVTILKGMIEDTKIGAGTKIGSNVNIGHNAVIGKNVYISSGVTIAGAAVIGDNCWISVGATVNDHVIMGRNSKAGTGSVIIKDTLENSFYLGNPARKISDRKD
jgi:UDP-3-O-[3-hydroxymyristoyl] glucosamine N-acyltransferase